MPAVRMISLYIALSFLFSACAFFEKKPIENNYPQPPIEPTSEDKQTVENEKVLMARLEHISGRVDTLEQQLNEQKLINASSNQKIKSLELELSKRNTIIHLQENVIKLLDDPENTIEKGLKDEINAKLNEFDNSEKQSKVVFYVKDLFRPNSMEISPKGKKLLLSLAGSIKDNPGQTVVVESHTDNIPVGNFTKKTYPSNWEISMARAAAVVRFLQESGNIEPKRLKAVGYSFYRPVASNKTKEGREKNRRVEILLGPPI